MPTNGDKIGKYYEIQQMLRSGRIDDANQFGKCGMTALHVAAAALNVRVMELLIVNGAKPELKDIQGRTIRSLIMNGEAVSDIAHKNHNRRLLERALMVASTDWIFESARSAHLERVEWLI